MLSHQLGFTTSWKMLTRDKGWIKPLLIIALVSWIPIVGPVVVLGYGLEWARLTAWGVDSAPKQRGVDLKKMVITGCTAYLISLLMGLVVVALGWFAFGGVFTVSAVSSGATLFCSDGGLEEIIQLVFDGSLQPWLAIVIFVVDLFLEMFILAAELRSTLYDSFTAGWRIDRLFQMVVRDFGGFVHVCAISALGAVIISACDGLVILIGGAIIIRSVIGLTFNLNISALMGSVMNVGILPALLILVLAVIILFAFQVLEVALQLVTINAMGQWFQRFDVNRWGVSADPLPQGTPHKEKSGTAPTSPEASASDDTPSGADDGSTASQTSPEQSSPASVASDVSSSTPHDVPADQVLTQEKDDEGPWSHPEADLYTPSSVTHGSDDGPESIRDATGEQTSTSSQGGAVEETINKVDAEGAKTSEGEVLAEEPDVETEAVEPEEGTRTKGAPIPLAPISSPDDDGVDMDQTDAAEAGPEH